MLLTEKHQQTVLNSRLQQPRSKLRTILSCCNAEPASPTRVCKYQTTATQTLREKGENDLNYTVSQTQTVSVFSCPETNLGLNNCTFYHISAIKSK